MKDALIRASFARLRMNLARRHMAPRKSDHEAGLFLDVPSTREDHVRAARYHIARIREYRK